jgi:hypothetical protein
MKGISGLGQVVRARARGYVDQPNAARTPPTNPQTLAARKNKRSETVAIPNMLRTATPTSSEMPKDEEDRNTTARRRE